MGSVFKRGGYWIVQYYDGAGKRRQVSTKTSDRATANRVLAKFVADAALRREGVHDARSDAFAANERIPLAEHVAEYIRTCEDRGQDEQHVATKRMHLERALGDTSAQRLSELTVDALVRFLRVLAVEGKSARTRNSYRQDLVAFGSWCVETGRRIDNPLKTVRKSEEREDRCR